MTCVECDGHGLVPFLPFDSRVSVEEATMGDLGFAVCLCPSGQALRVSVNAKRRVAPQWVLWAARHSVDPSRVALLENVFSAEDVAAAGFSRPVAQMNREAALLAASRKGKL
jgi:hypothetical protein